MNIVDSDSLYRKKSIEKYERLLKEVNGAFYVTGYCGYGDFNSDGLDIFVVKEKVNSWWKFDQTVCRIECIKKYTAGGFKVGIEISGGKLETMTKIGAVFDKLKWITTIIDNGT